MKLCVFSDKPTPSVDSTTAASPSSSHHKDGEVVTKPATASPTKTKLRKKLNNYRLRVYRLKQKVRKLEMNEGKSTSTKKKIERIGESISEFVKGPKYDFIMSQIRNATVKSAGKRWTYRDKSFALSLYHSSPKTYKLLRNALDLPSPQTLRKIMRNVAVYPGFNENILKALQLKLKGAPESSKLVVITIDEMAIKEGVTFDKGRDLLEGYAETPNREEVLANHALVFMVRGFMEKWKQPVGYFLSSGPMKANAMKDLLFECMEKLKSVGLTPVILVCDQGTNNQSLYKRELGVTTDAPFFFHENSKIFAMYDPPHLIKNIRNNLHNHGLELDKKKLLWSHVEDFYTADTKYPVRIAPKLKKKHVYLPPFTALSVRLATQVLSHTVASGMKIMAQWKVISKNAKHTADFIEHMDKLFNSFNSKVINTGKNESMQGAITSSSGHITFLKEMLDYMKRLKTLGKKKPACFEGWRLSINAVMSLWNHLQSQHEFKFLLTNRLNQDCLENLFCIIRAKGAQRDNPDAAQFRAAFRQVMVDMVMVPSKQANCEGDVDEFLCSLEEMKKSAPAPSQLQPPTPSVMDTLPFSVRSILSVCSFLNHAEQEELTKQESNILAYIAGYIVRKIVGKCCQPCSEKFKAHAVEENPNHELIQEKSYGKLQTPSQLLLGLVQLLEIQYRKVIRTIISTENVKAKLALEFSKVAQLQSFKCDQCHQHLLIVHIMINIRVHHSIREINNGLKDNKSRKNRKTAKCSHL